MFARDPHLRLGKGNVWRLDLDDGAVDDIPDAPRVNPALVAVNNEDVLESPAVEERDPPRDPVHLADGLDPGSDKQGQDARSKRQVDVEEEQLFAV